MTLTEQTPVIQKTFEYAKFKLLPENRPINKYKVARIAESIEEDDQSAFRPILVDKNFGIIDGQHQFKALMKLERPIYFVQNPDASLRSIALLNSFTTSWGLANYAHFYAKQGLKPYQEVIQFAEKYHVSISLAVGALTMTFHGMSNLKNDFKEGVFQITHREEAVVLMDEVTELRPFLIGNTIADREFYRAYIILRSQIDFTVLRDTLAQKRLKIEPRSVKKDYLREFEDILNYEKSKNLVRLY
jgi:hypothetical protein